MTFILSIFLLLTNIIASFFTPRSRFFWFLLILFMWLLFWGNYRNVDSFNYATIYYYFEHGGKVYIAWEPGFQLMMQLGGAFGFNYFGFLAFYSALGLILIHNTISKYSKNVNFVIILYFIYPFLLDVVQIRNFFAMSVVIFSVRYLVSDKKYSTWKYVLFILLAFSIHYAAILYLPLGMVKKWSIKKTAIIVSIITGLGVVLVYTNIFQSLIAPLAPTQKVAKAFEIKSRLGFLSLYLYQTISFCLFYFSATFFKKKYKEQMGISNEIQEKNDLKLKFVDILIKINIFAFIFFIFYIFDGTYERTYRNLLVLNYIVYALAINCMKITIKRFLYGAVIIIFALWCFSYFILYHYTDTVFFPVFENSLIF